MRVHFLFFIPQILDGFGHILNSFYLDGCLNGIVVVGLLYKNWIGLWN